ncbi:cytochrome c oxidase assembly protein COX14 homolog isoform X1 [Neoarius graeffei]|uniref:cytochrome c oxidase assembly protein COX14 homolog isoform X1 n=2 Tax=Neoarius graeffei TaxID=443677 RepID=UPI00298BCBF3|nr:cytochrome c oxidase assembly protein COX14 homolog isoform X1 [Neoarius graeffei]
MRLQPDMGHQDGPRGRRGQHLNPTTNIEFLMLSTKHLADVGYRVFSGSMMLLTLYGGYLCTLRGYRYVQRQKQLQLAAQNQSIDPEIVKD